MRIAFYAPLKSPDDPVPSGDRLIGRMLIAALQSGGHDVRVVSRLRTFDRTGDRRRQERLARIGSGCQRRVLRRMAATGWRPELWLTYHLYHKAPDWIGPAVAARLAIPYCVAEASSSPRQGAGPWAHGHAAVADALRQAALVLSLNPKDVPGIRPLLGAGGRIVDVAPFIDGAPFRAARGERTCHRARLSEALEIDPGVPWLLAVGMMRAGDKAASYRVLADALGALRDRPWRLLAIGDGEARGEIEAFFATFGRRVHWLGRRPTAEVAGVMAASDLMVWPAINEAIGMVFIEAAMAGLPVVAADRPGIAAVVDRDATALLVAEGDAAAFARAVATLLDDPARRSAMGRAAAAWAQERHDVATAGRAVSAALEMLRP